MVVIFCTVFSINILKRKFRFESFYIIKSKFLKKIIREIKPVLNKEERQLKRNGESVWYLTSKVPFFDEEGALV